MAGLELLCSGNCITAAGTALGEREELRSEVRTQFRQSLAAKWKDFCFNSKMLGEAFVNYLFIGKAEGEREILSAA